MTSRGRHKTATVQTFKPRASLDEPLDWDAVGLPVLGEAFAERQAAWRAEFERTRFVIPRLRRRGPRPKYGPKLNLNHAPETTYTWSGGIAIPAAGDRMDWVEGRWAAPYVSLPPNPIGGQNYILSSWVGMDGDYGSRHVLQAGVDANIDLTEGAMHYRYVPWFQWYPDPAHTIDGVHVSPGDVVGCQIVMTPGSSTSAKVVFTNQTNGQGAVKYANAPSVAAAVTGICAEWIVEAFGNLGPIAGFKSVEFDNCYSGTSNGQTIASGQGTTITMLAASGGFVATAALDGPTSVIVTSV
jgi:hypothetical protein